MLIRLSYRIGISGSLALQTPPMADKLEGKVEQMVVAEKWMFPKDEKQEDWCPVML